MIAKKMTCKVVSKQWLTPTVLSVYFSTSKRLRFEAGQFISLIIPSKFAGSNRPIRRAYTLASSPDVQTGVYELCIKVLSGGTGGGYLASLRFGEEFQISAPYGDFLFQPNGDRSVCFISTGTGIAPFRSIVLSDRFQAERPEQVISIFGCRDENEIIYPRLFDGQEIESVFALTRSTLGWSGGFHGRVTDYLRSLPRDWGWHSMDYYLCGNPSMVGDARRILEGHGVSAQAIRQEAYFQSAEQERRNVGLQNIMTTRAAA